MKLLILYSCLLLCAYTVFAQSGVSLLSPVGGEVFHSGQMGEIHWKGSGNKALRITLWDAYRGTYQIISNDANMQSGVFKWSVPETEGAMFRIILNSPDDSLVVDMSKAFFRIEKGSGGAISAGSKQASIFKPAILKNDGRILQVSYVYSSTAVVSLHDINGKELRNVGLEQSNISSSEAVVSCNISELVSGTYLLVFRDAQYRESLPLTVVK